MNNDETELGTQERVIRKSLAYVFIPILILLITISVIQDNAVSHLERAYKNIQNTSYSGKITNLFPKQAKGRTYTILISNKWEKEIPFFIYNQLSIGDSLFKTKQSDFEYYIKKLSNDTIQRDVNKFYRTKYYNKRNE
ncbi:hypothetical protein [Winogradskyella wichelsiae]|uniref:hypothetical protein n=1 Tax=Winogradskyella wichelsiae TaxID=2697007 RepID=UPI0018626D7A|nr:hypothetical protein H7F37_01590 [Winogradskyella sp. PAMC22761]